MATSLAIQTLLLFPFFNPVFPTTWSSDYLNRNDLEWWLKMLVPENKCLRKVHIKKPPGDHYTTKTWEHPFSLLWGKDSFFSPSVSTGCKTRANSPCHFFYFRDCAGPGMGCKIKELVYSEDFFWMCTPTFWNWHKGAKSWGTQRNRCAQTPNQQASHSVEWFLFSSQRLVVSSFYPFVLFSI